MAGQQQQQGGGGGDNSLDFLWLIVMLVLAIGFVWYFFRAEIVTVVFNIRYYEILAIKAVLDVWAIFANAVGLPLADTKQLNQWANYIHATPADVSFSSVTQVSTIVGDYLRYPVMLVLVGFGLFMFRSHVKSKFRQIFKMKDLRDVEQENWPQITPVVKLNLIDEDIDEGPWAMAMTPLQFCRKHKIYKEDKTKDGRPIAVVEKGPAHRVFALQLGAQWKSLEALPIHTQALFAAFAARGNRDTDGANNLLQNISKSSATGKLDFSGARELLAKHVGSKFVGRTVGSHGYVNTVMPSMLVFARTDGVVSCSEFLWLKPIDRKLWFTLNSVGRPTAVSEVAGIFSHWLAETALGRPLRVPMVEEAVIAMDDALQSILYEPEED